MRFLKAVLALAGFAVCSGCGYIHFGRLPEPATATGDASGAGYTNLLTEQKILKQELALARKEGDTLRAALDRGGAASPEVMTQLNQATRELATLRASHAKLQAGNASAAQLSEVEEKLAASLRNFTQLQEENARLRVELDKARAENVTLSGQLKSVTTENTAAQNTIAQLNSELVAQKEARARAEQATSAVKAQLGVVMAARDATPPPPTTAMGSGNSTATSALALAKAPAADLSATAELRTNPERVRNVEPAPTTPPKRIHVVAAGDTLEKIADKYYGDRREWVRLYTTNSAKLRDGGTLTPGMELEIPEKR